MTAGALRALAQVHGALAWAAVAALGVALVSVWRSKRGAVMGSVAGALAVAAFVTGALLHGPFQGKLRQRLFVGSAALGWLFERKEHAAVGALALGLCGAVALGAAALAEEGAAKELRRAGALALSAALVLHVLAAVVSVVVARRVGF